MPLQATPPLLWPAPQVFAHLSSVGPCWETEPDPWFIKRLPFRNQDADDQPHPGTRAYPFLGQVCKKWKHLLLTDMAKVGWVGWQAGRSIKVVVGGEGPGQQQ